MKVITVCWITTHVKEIYCNVGNPQLLPPHANSNYLYPSAGHVITGNLNVARVRNIISKKVLNIDFPLILISLNVVERSLLL